MKARIRTKEEIYLYHIAPESEKGLLLSKGLDKLGLSCRFLEDSCWTQPVGYCVGAPGYPEKASEDVPPESPQELFLMKDLSPARRDQVLAAFRDKTLPQVELKAIVTPHNQAWPLGKLIAELTKEHACMKAYEALKATAARAREALLNGGGTEELKARLEQAEALLRSRTPHPEEAYHKAKQALENKLA